MKSANDRLVKWTERWAGDSKPECISIAMKANIASRMNQVFTDQVAVEEAVKTILGEAATPVLLNGFYHGFGKQVFSAMGKFTGPQLIAIVDVYVSRWVGAGLDRDILERIRNTVFTLTAPTP